MIQRTILVVSSWMVGLCFLVGCAGAERARPEGLPATAFWAQSVDRGCWIEKIDLVSTEEEVAITLKGYAEESGALEWTATFHCTDEALLETYPALYELMEQRLLIVNQYQLLWKKKVDGEYCSCDAY